MKPVAIVGLILIILGVFVISYDYIPPRKEVHHIGIGPVGVTAVQEKPGSNPMPLVLGVLSIVAGLYFIFRKK